jgi:hypothetical protein
MNLESLRKLELSYMNIIDLAQRGIDANSGIPQDPRLIKNQDNYQYHLGCRTTARKALEALYNNFPELKTSETEINKPQ